MAETILRHATLADAQAMGEVLAASWRSAYRDFVHGEYLETVTPERWIDPFRQGMEDESAEYWVAQQGEKIVGVAVVRGSVNEHYPDDGELVALYVLPEVMGTRVGHQLTVAVEASMREKGFKNYILNVLEDNAHAIAFYRTHGFVQTEHTDKVKLGDKEYTCLVFRKLL